MSSTQRSSTRKKRSTIQYDLSNKSLNNKRLSQISVKDKVTIEVTGEVRDSKRGIYYASELLHYRDAFSFYRENSDVEQVCIIRFPDDIAAIIRSRLGEQLPASDDLDILDFSSLKGDDLGLVITPTPEYDYRLFKIQVEKKLGVSSSAVHLVGILVELPCLLEAYKSLEGDLLFKSNNISQMIYVYDPNTSEIPFDINQIQNSQLWEWHSGLTPGTHRIRHRKFKNFNVFDRSDVIVAEREICNILNQRGTHQLCYLEAASEFNMEEHLNAIDNGFEPNVTAVIGPENPILYSAVHKMKPSQAVSQFDEENVKSNLLLRKYAQKKSINDVSLKDKLKFTNKVEFCFDENDDIPSDLSDYLFDELQFAVDPEKEDAQLEEEIRKFAYSTMTNETDKINSDNSLSNEEDTQTRKQRRHKSKKEQKSIKSNASSINFGVN